MEIKKCPVCGSEKLQEKRRIGYCSQKCVNAPLKKINFENDCLVCKKHYVSIYKIDYIKDHPNKTPKFCSRECLYTFRRNRQEIICEWCGKSKGVKVSSLNHPRAGLYHFCNKVCMGKYYCGIKAPNYVHGKTPEHVRIRHSPEYLAWRIAVFIRDNRTCVWCGSKKRIEADHIKPFSLFPELRTVVENGRTLCHECHMKTPTYHLDPKLTREEFELTMV
jgi:5-methylcytosine-specific restriction endonuclease McrA